MNERASSSIRQNLAYLSGWGNEHASEAIPGAIPEGQSSPQKVAYGLYAEKFSHTAFTVPRNLVQRSWLYRIRPSVGHGRFKQIDQGRWQNFQPDAVVTPARQLRWDPPSISERIQDFIGGMTTIVNNGDLMTQSGTSISYYLANTSMDERYFFNCDAEMLIIPQQGRLLAHTEFGILDLAPGEILLVPRGVKFRVVLQDDEARGYVCENFGHQYVLPERGPVGTDGYANNRDFKAPTAAYETRSGDFELVCKHGGHLFACDIKHSPLDVVGWFGSSTCYKYDLNRFNVMGSVSYDHPDPSIYTVLHSPSDTVGCANSDFVIFPPRWMVAENTFRPPWYHRNVMSEFMGLIEGQYDAKPDGFVPGGASLHNCMLPHGPDLASFTKATHADLEPEKMVDTMAFMLESRFLMRPTEWALNTPLLQENYDQCWDGLQSNFDPPSPARR